MAFAANAPVPDRQRSPPVGLSLSNLSSNNPFRNRAASPLNSPFLESPSLPAPPRPMSTNPFLDNSELGAAPARAPVAGSGRANSIPDDIFGELSLLDRAPSNDRPPPPPNAPPSRAGPPPPYRPTNPDERRAPPRPPRGPNSPIKREFRGPPQQRRASESSMMDKERRPRIERDGERPPRTESEERRRRERRKEREDRHRREKEKIRNGDKGEKSEKKSRKPQGLDIIDKLDVTGIYGQGLFHHDGPFDACNPHRNARKDRRAPMQAFPADSANMALGGAGPLNSRLDLDKFHGRGAEGFSEYAATRKAATNVMVDPTSRIEPVHGEESYGLGTSTFLEGAPASRSALQRRDSEEPSGEATGGGGLSRKKSLAQRFRGMSTSKRNPGDYRSPEPRYQPGSSDLDAPPSTQPQFKAMSAGGPVRATHSKEDEVNPFENDYEDAFERKGTQIRIAEQEKPSRAPSSPNGPSLTRSKTSEASVPTRARGSSNEEDRPSGGGFLSRMKSLKGGPRRPRNE